MKDTFKAIIIGAGPSGIGMAIALKELGLQDVMILDKGKVGESFINWPDTTRFITPSFTTNGFGTPDINAITPHSSPAFTFKKEHISGFEYAQYLNALTQIYELNIKEHTEVIDISTDEQNYSYTISTEKKGFKADYIFIGTGNFSFPHKPFKHGVHYCEIKNFSNVEGETATIIGGNESGFDAAIHLALLGKKVDIYTNSTSYDQQDPDPSVRLSPYTHQRYVELVEQGYPIKLHSNYSIEEIDFINNQYTIRFENQTRSITVANEPILATGFNPVQNNPLTNILFENNGNSYELTDDDESTINQNIFLIGDTVKHQDIILCYIYKFRTRFAVLANLVCEREGIEANEDAIEFYKNNQMYLDDYSCCEVDCSC
ncbi:NAD(P)/FAD-dependent oxidoreductase [Mammaliicoccus lentus]|uniref:NAD(P)/FAD-dependent oxidoreductase n=1 Tax=Mammaliicoccus lentus TaxID=42858 RepID=UPI001C4F3F4B|nr:NAD(P)/FAD-dependent oxidoreductase [Mammaliicoccus lentus]MBW0768031.1 NAD(P)-binding domain-containing protein [Mammaliicoccus lentus]